MHAPLVLLPLALLAAAPTVGKPTHAKPPARLAAKKVPARQALLKKLRPSDVLRTVPTRVTLFYSYQDKKTGQTHKAASVSNTVKVPVVKATTLARLEKPAPPAHQPAHPGR